MTPELGTATVIQADARDLPIPTGSVDLVVTSPPYFALRSYKDAGAHYAGQIGAETTPAAFVDALLEVTRECVRVLKPTGSLWVNLGDKYAGSNGQAGGPSQLAGATYSPDGTRTKGAKRGGFVPQTTVRHKSLIGVPWRYALACVDDLGLILRAEVIWSKPNGLPESVTDRVRRSHETWFHFVTQPRYFSAVDEIREAYDPRTQARYDAGFTPEKRLLAGIVSTARDRGVLDGDGGPKQTNPLGKLPGSVWTVPTEPLIVPDNLGVDHFAAFPTEWPRRIIQGWSPTGAVVLDPFGGTGTTALVAKALGRHGITVDMSNDYCRLAEWRTNDRNQLANVLDLPRITPQPDTQPTLFDV